MQGKGTFSVQRLAAFSALVRKWNKSINLVAKSEIKRLEQRHIKDSEQMFHVKQDWSGHYVDLGSGGGFPGVIVAIHLAYHSPATKVTLVESDTRKATFLRTANRELGLDMTIDARRIEDVEPLQATVMSARALASLDKLLHLSQKHRTNQTICLFPKGQQWHSEVIEARSNYGFNLSVHPSQTRDGARILELQQVRPL